MLILSDNRFPKDKHQIIRTIQRIDFILKFYGTYFPELRFNEKYQIYYCRFLNQIFQDDRNHLKF